MHRRVESAYDTLLDVGRRHAYDVALFPSGIPARRNAPPCHLRSFRMRMAEEWIEQYRAYWEESFDRLDAYLKTVVSQEKAKGKKHGSGK